MLTYSKSFFTTQQTGSKRSAEVVVPLVMDLIQPKSVADIGCGVGTWLAVFQAHKVEEILGVDGAYVDPKALHIPASSFRPHDLTQPLRLNRYFDLATSLEVGEHLPASAAGRLVDTLTSLAPVVLFSAAIPHQGGLHHINEQWPQYWTALFEQRGYRVIDCLRRRIWTNPAVDWCYAQNLLLYATPSAIEQNPALRRFLEETHPDQLAVVHPRKYLEQCDPDHITIRNLSRWLPVLVKGLPKIVGNAIKRHVK